MLKYASLHSGLTIAMTALVCVALALPVQARTPPTIATTKVDGTDNGYILSYVRHRCMSIPPLPGWTPTDPVGLRTPLAIVLIEAIRTSPTPPITYVLYRDSHFAPTAGRQTFDASGPVSVEYRNATASIAA